MVPLSINELTTFRWSFEEDVLRYRAAGITAMGVWRAKLADYGEERGAELLAEHGMAVSNLFWAGGFTGGEAASAADTIADCEVAIELAAELNAGCLVVNSGGRAGHTQRHAQRQFCDALKILDPIAAVRGVTLAVEPMHRAVADSRMLFTTVDQALDAIDAADCRATQLVFDTYHLGHGRLSPRRIAEIAPRVAIVHLADARHAPRGEQNRCRMGCGVLPLGDIVAALIDGGYRGYYDIELFGEDVELLDYMERISHSQRVFSRLNVPALADPRTDAGASSSLAAADRCDFQRGASRGDTTPRRAVG
ncbi:MAG: sugar phosphate isomerase/epimerase family protein [Pirellulales bacterium]